MIYLDVANDTVRAGFDYLIDIIKILVNFLKQIPTGFGVSLYYFLIATIITGIVLSGIVNVVKASSLNAYNDLYYRREVRRVQLEHLQDNRSD